MIGATLNGGQCLVAPPQRVRLGDTIRVEFENEADVAASVGLFVGEFPADAVPAGEIPVFGLPVQPGGRNAGDWRPRDEVTFTIACLDATTLGQIGAGIHLTVVGS